MKTTILATCAVLCSALTAQTSCIDTNYGTNLNMGDDTMVQGLALGFTFTYNGVGYTSICLDSNGSIYLGATTTAFSDFSPSLTSFLSSPQPRICPLWNDFQANAAGSGQIYFNAVPASPPNGAFALITWDNVYEFATTNRVLMQVKLDASSGITITYGTNAAQGGLLNPNQLLIGATPGLGALSNPVSFATRPVVITSNNFDDQPITGYTGFQMTLTPTPPAGYLAIDNSCVVPPSASAEVIGVGCPPFARPSVYETFGVGAPDINGMDFTFLPNGLGSYLVLPGISGPFFTGFANNLGAGDDTTHLVTLPFPFPHGAPGSFVNDIYVSSNGFLTLGNVDPFSGCCTGDPFDFLNNEPRISAWWADLNPGSAGGVFADLDTVTGDFVITWNAVPEYFSSGANTFQIALSPSGTFSIRLQSINSVSHDFLTGYSSGHGAADNPADLSALTSLDLGLYAPSQEPLVHDIANGSPQLGTNFDTSVSGFSPAPNGNVAIMVIGFTELNPGVDLGLIGAPGCNAYLLPSANDFQFFALVGGAPSVTFSTAIPNNSVFAGVQVISECVSDDASLNSFGWKFSNGIRWTLGI